VRGLVVTPENQPIKWEWLEEARGNVTVPSGFKVKLKVSGKGSGSLAPVAALGCDDLHTLDLSRSEISDISLTHLHHLTELKVLELTATDISDEGLALLDTLVNLQGLGLSHCHISGVGLSRVRNLTNLRELWLSAAEINDDDLQYLFKMTKLVQVGLSGTKITDSGLKRLSILKDLMRIYLFNTDVSQAGVESFRQIVPGCRVKWKPTPQLDASLVDIDPSTPIEDLLSGLPPEVRSAFALPLEVGSADADEWRPLADDTFWQIIDTLDWDKVGTDNAVIEPAVKLLSTKKDREILAFADMLSEKLHALDGEAFAREIGQDAYKGPQTRFSKSCFLSARCCVIANGRQFYEQVLEDPALMPKDMEFEALVRIPSLAYERKNGKRLSYITKLSYETFSNKPAWPTQHTA
jgi:hypothetical protein